MSSLVTVSAIFLSFGENREYLLLFMDGYGYRMGFEAGLFLSYMPRRQRG